MPQLDDASRGPRHHELRWAPLVLGMVGLLVWAARRGAARPLLARPPSPADGGGEPAPLRIAVSALALAGMGVLLATPADQRHRMMTDARDALVALAEQAVRQARARARTDE
jgi:hypothetical protein